MRERVTRYAGLFGAPDRRRFKNMFTPSLPTPPAITPPPVMPDPANPTTLAAQKAAEAKANAGGRSATTLTRAGGTIAGAGGAPYSANKLSGTA